MATVLDVGGRVVAPGFIDPHGGSDGSLFLDGALASHLIGVHDRVSGNCGDTLAPLTARGREIVELSLRPNELIARWAIVRGVSRGRRRTAARSQRGVPGRSRDDPRVGPRDPRPAADLRRAGGDGRRGRRGARCRGDRPVLGGSSTRPGCTPSRPRWRHSWPPRPGGAASTRPTCATRPMGCSRRSTSRSPPSVPPGPGGRLQVSHLKCGSHGRSGVAPPRRRPRLERGAHGRPRCRRQPEPLWGRRDDAGDHPAAGVAGPGCRGLRGRARRSGRP